jgi:hypothetical protein
MNIIGVEVQLETGGDEMNDSVCSLHYKKKKLKWNK